jgi:hypothetical protein
MVPAPALAPADFAMPWRDLRTRLEAGLVALNERRRALQRTNPVEEIRLIWKRDALDDSLTAWERINDQLVRGDIDLAIGWRTFTEQVAHLYTVSSVNTGYYEGVSVALSYQRGYGADIDAPDIPNPHTGR